MYDHTDERWELLEAMMELRAEFAINHAIKGFGMDIEKALELIRNKNNGLSRLEREQRDILVAAIDNLIDFAVAQEFQMSQHLPNDFDYNDQTDIDECEDIFTRMQKLKMKTLNMPCKLPLHGQFIQTVQYSHT